ncbi:MAG: hypothetical protein ACFE8J_04185 [Candidatus Heimdallarchaeota archaeon]
MTYKMRKSEEILMLWGFLLLFLGIMGVVWMGILEGVSEIIIYAILLVIIGLFILIVLVIVDKKKSNM